MNQKSIFHGQTFKNINKNNNKFQIKKNKKK